jgi:multiple sugar transport system permease protein
MGACQIVSLPIAVLFNFFVNRFVAGFTVVAIE